MSKNQNKIKSELPIISLYTGAGGLDLGLEKAGFTSRICVEIDNDARSTLKKNRPDWLLANPGDIYQLTPDEIMAQAGLKQGETFLLAGGPPCQPFSKSGFWVKGDTKRLNDPRSNTLVSYIEVLEKSLPKVLLLENVKGLTYKGKSEGLDYLTDSLEKINNKYGTNYNVHILSINAANYGIPQTRERVFLIASREGHSFSPPVSTHSETKEVGKKLYNTAWDAIGDLENNSWDEDLSLSGKWADLLPSIPEGQNYQWHTPQSSGKPIFGWRTRYWSFLLKLAKNKPSWTIQAQPGPATGPFHWKNRLLSTRELCRIQTIPDDYEIIGSRRSTQKQIGNAVPPAIGELLGKEIRKQFFNHKVSGTISLIRSKKNNAPQTEKVMPVPKKYYQYVDENKKPHPGTGKGPRAKTTSENSIS